MLSACLDGEIRPEDRAAIEAHLVSCEDCRRRLKELSGIKDFFRISGGYAAPLGFSARVLAAVREERPARPGWGRRLVLAAEGFAVAAVALAGIMTGSLALKTAPPAAGTAMASRFSLDMFEAAPAGSVAAAYLAMTGGKDER